MDDGLKTLFALYKGPFWRETNVSEEEISAAKKQGYLFDYPAYETHEDTFRRRNAILAQVDPGDVANAFLFSLSTRRLEYRSALGSYYYARAIPAHTFMHSHNERLAAAAVHCYYCGWHAWKKEPDVFDKRFGCNVFNYERYRYGGVHHTNINYALFDLEQFLKLPKANPTQEDKQILAGILSSVDRLNAPDKAGKLREAITKAKILKSNKDEVSVLLNILGICGILAGKEHPSYDEYFADEYERDPTEYRNDFAYPVNRWRAGDGVNAEKLKEVFGEECKQTKAEKR